MAKENVGYKIILGVTEAKKGIKELDKALGNTKMTIDDVGKSIKKAFSRDTSFIGTIKSMKSIIELTMKASEAEAEYVESMNLLAVSYRQDTEEGEKLYNQTNELLDSMKQILGLDPAKLTQEVGIYKQMTSAMGMTNEQSALLSRNLIKLQQDTASLYNLQSSEVATKFQSALAGQTRAVRSLGVDITQASLQQELYNLGIDKSITELNRASKTVLIYLAMQRQLKNANGDASRTINSMANQMKQFKEQISIASRQIGAMFIPVLQRILPIANAILMVFNDIMEIILGIFGVDVQTMATEFGQKSIDIGEGLGTIADNAEKVNKSLRGFDKLNNITTPDKNKSKGAGANIGKVDDALLKQLKDYNLHLDETKNKARAIADQIEKWLIYTDETGKKHLTPLAKTLALIAGATILGKIIKGVSTIYKALSMVSGGGASTSLLGSALKSLKSLNKEGKVTLTGAEKLQTVLAGGILSASGMVLLGSMTAHLRETNQEFGKLRTSWEGWVGALASVGGGALAGSAFGPVGTAIGAVAGALGGTTAMLIEGLKPLTTYADETKHAKEEAEKFTTEVNNQRDAIYKDRDAKLESIEVNKKQVKRLQAITDEQGKVKKGYEDEAKVIINDLNEAYGTHMKLVDGKIQGYDNEINRINSLIDAQRAEAFFEAKKEDYINSLKSQSKAQSELYFAQRRYNSAVNESNSIQKEHDDLLKEYNEIIQSGNKDLPQYRSRLTIINAKLAENESKQKKVNKVVEDAKKTVDEYSKEYEKSTLTIDQYQRMSIAMQEKNYKEVERIAQESGVNTYKAIASSLERQISLLDKGSPLTTDIIAGYRHLADNSVKDYKEGLSKLEPETALEIDKTIQKLDTSDLATHFGKLSKKSEEQFLHYLRFFPADVQSEIVDKMQEKGYKISENLQKGIDKVKIETKLGIELPKDADVKKLINDFVAKVNKLSGKDSWASGFFSVLSNNKSNTKKKAKGGFVGEGEMFIAREAGPEMVGTINNKTAVANNDQIVSAITSGVMVGVSRAMANTGTSKVVIEASGDTEGLMNFITFKQKEKERQYGM